MSARALEGQTYDAIVVGSGMTGGWAAKELTEAGLRTLVLERGGPVEHGMGYKTAALDPWDVPYGNMPTQQDLRDYAIQSQLSFLFGQDVKHFLVKDVDHPYEQVKPFNWYRGYQVGGRSLLWSRHCFRWSDLDFEANLKEGVGIDWPIRYADLAPWYDRVQAFIGISGEKAGLPQLPEGDLLPPFEMNCFERHLRRSIETSFPGRNLIMSHVAVLTRPHNGRGACQGRNLCHRGCPYGAYFSSNSSTLPAAAATGRLTLRPHSIAHSLICDHETGRAKGIRVIDAETGKATEFFARLARQYTLFFALSAALACVFLRIVAGHQLPVTSSQKSRPSSLIPRPFFLSTQYSVLSTLFASVLYTHYFGAWMGVVLGVTGLLTLPRRAWGRRRERRRARPRARRQASPLQMRACERGRHGPTGPQDRRR